MEKKELTISSKLEIGNQLKKSKLHEELTIRDISELLEVPKHTITSVLNGVMNGTAKSWDKLSWWYSSNIGIVDYAARKETIAVPASSQKKAIVGYDLLINNFIVLRISPENFRFLKTIADVSINDKFHKTYIINKLHFKTKIIT